MGRSRFLCGRAPENNYSMFPVYIQSKLGNVLFADELQRRLDKMKSAIRVNTLHPGNVHTEVTRNYPAIVRMGYALSRPLMFLIEKTPAAGASTSIYVATAPELRGVGGKYFVHSTAVEKGPGASLENAAALWKHTEAVLSRIS